jgi:hypothetical protein
VSGDSHSGRIARENVARIAIGQKGRFSAKIGEAEKSPGEVVCCPIFGVSDLLAALARATVFLPMEEVARLLPVNVIEIIQ